MASLAAVVRKDIEGLLSSRIPGALSPIPQQSPRLLPLDDTHLDALLGGGLPLGSLCEATGVEGSGRTSLAMSLLRSASAEFACAYVDVSDTFSPHCAAAAGVNLQNLLWVRLAVSTSPAQLVISRPSAPLPITNHREDRQMAQQNCGSPHPRGETKNLGPALEKVLSMKHERRERKQEGTPGYPNQPIGLHTASKEQVDWERFNLRRVDETDPLRQMDRIAADAVRERSSAAQGEQHVSEYGRSQTGWNRLDAALRAVDQILQAGGFRVVVFDLGSIPPDQAMRIPSATWWRLQKSAGKSDAVFLLLTQEPCARSTASCVLLCDPPEHVPLAQVLAGITRNVQVGRQRAASTHGKKAPGRSTEWNCASQWMRAVRETA